MSKYKHGLSKEKLYGVWSGMISRCYHKNCNQYKNYGGRGIKVCEEWANNFLYFYEWALTNGYKAGLSIDRIDVDKDYSPDNCRWINMSEQQLNRRDTIWIVFRGQKIPLRKLVDKFGLDISRVEDFLIKEEVLRK